MADILIRGVPPRVVSRLKSRASAKGRSLQAELKEILADAAANDMSRVRELARKMRRELAGRPHSDSVDLLREDRDR